MGRRAEPKGELRDFVDVATDLGSGADDGRMTFGFGEPLRATDGQWMEAAVVRPVDLAPR